jgi:3-oxoacyl-[acyl-carrier-protein] synthase II
MPADRRRDVVITGLGATTPLGGDTASTWEGLLAGRSGVRALTEEWAQELPVGIAAPVAVDPGGFFAAADSRRLDRVSQLALVAAREAWAHAGLGELDCAEPGGVDRERLSVVVSSGAGGVASFLDAHERLAARGARGVSPYTVPMLIPNASAAHIALAVGAEGSVHAPASACASGAEAIALAGDLIRWSRADIVIAGAAEAVIHPTMMAGFAAMRALSTRRAYPETASRPFDKNRDGFVLGEGAGIMVLEDAEHARARGARVWGRLLGHGLSTDAHHIAQPRPDGARAAQAMLRALRDAEIQPRDIAHVNAHATSTPLGDRAEARALRAALGSHVEEPLVTANKSMIGHLQGAAGAVEALIAVLSLHHRTVPPTINLDDPDDDTPLRHARWTPHPLRTGPVAALSNSFGFGGHNAVLVLAAD